MSYRALVCRITTSPHPNADRLQVADAGGHTCIVGLDHDDDELGIVFPEGGQLDHGFCMVNNLYRKNPETGEAMGGYLEESRRVRAVKLRGVESGALWLPISALNRWFDLRGIRRTLVCEGMAIDELHEHVLCQKYLTPATRRAMQSSSSATRQQCRRALALEKHYDTPQLRNANRFIAGDIAIVTEKLHGTSGRTGHVEVDQELGWFSKLVNKLPWVDIKPACEWERVTGTRNTIFDTEKNPNSFRTHCHNMLAPHLLEDEVVYYEIVGFEETGRPIRSPHSITGIGDSKIERRLRQETGQDSVVYHYGCLPDGRMPGSMRGVGDHPRFKAYVYRITRGGNEMRWDYVMERTRQLHHGGFIDVVPTLGAATVSRGGGGKALREKCDELSRGQSRVGGVPIREGVCVRIERGSDRDMVIERSLKHKSFVFCALEGIRKNDPDYIDTEEVA